MTAEARPAGGDKKEADACAPARSGASTIHVDREARAGWRNMSETGLGETGHVRHKLTDHAVRQVTRLTSVSLTYRILSSRLRQSCKRQAVGLPDSGQQLSQDVRDNVSHPSCPNAAINTVCALPIPPHPTPPHPEHQVAHPSTLGRSDDQPSILASLAPLDRLPGFFVSALGLNHGNGRCSHGVLRGGGSPAGAEP